MRGQAKEPEGLEAVLQLGREMLAELAQLEDRLYRQLVLLTLHVEGNPSEAARLEARRVREQLLEVRAQLDADRAAAGGAR